MVSSTALFEENGKPISIESTPALRNPAQHFARKIHHGGRNFSIRTLATKE